ncbi:Txe/YoeB family addiction module toxin [Dactylosporangium sp. NPDC049525]|uniref:Txe/YoeB family addiction module toxin n=1 Tax=Dactylosporangium sp. NPDC049525 TaxID=3154730 RepID=UPI00342A6699
MKISWDRDAWDDYLWWQANNRQLLRRINQLIEDVVRNGNAEGIGKPERLRHQYDGYWSRRIDHEHRLVYAANDNELHIIACRYHYS